MLIFQARLQNAFQSSGAKIRLADLIKLLSVTA